MFNHTACPLNACVSNLTCSQSLYLIISPTEPAAPADLDNAPEPTKMPTPPKMITRAPPKWPAKPTKMPGRPPHLVNDKGRRILVTLILESN